MSNITLGQYYKQKSFLHDLDPRTKLFSTFIFFVMVFLCDNVYKYLAVALFTGLVIYLSKIPLKHIFRGLKPVLYILVITAFFNMFFTRGLKLFSFKIFRYEVIISKEGLYFAFTMTARIILVVLFSSLLTYTTTPKKIVDGMEKSFGFLKKIKIPVGEIAMIMLIAMRFIPVMSNEARKIMDAQRIRGMVFEDGNFLERGKKYISIVIPLFVATIKKGDLLATAMECRCYNPDSKRGKLYPLKYAKKDMIVYFIMIILLLVMIFIWR